MSVVLDIERLKECREALGITRQEAAKRVGISQPAYVRYENGTRKPSLQVINEIARTFNTSTAYLTGKTKQKNPDYIIIDKSASPLLYSVIEQCEKYSEDQLKRLLAYSKKLKE